SALSMRWLARAMGGPRLRFAEAMLMMPMLIWVAVTPTSVLPACAAPGLGSGAPGLGTPTGAGGRVPRPAAGAAVAGAAAPGLAAPGAAGAGFAAPGAAGAGLAWVPVLGPD